MKLKETPQSWENRLSNACWSSNQRASLAKEWEEAKLYQRRQELNQGKPSFHLA